MLQLQLHRFLDGKKSATNKIKWETPCTCCTCTYTQESIIIIVIHQKRLKHIIKRSSLQRLKSLFAYLMVIKVCEQKICYSCCFFPSLHVCDCKFGYSSVEMKLFQDFLSVLISSYSWSVASLQAGGEKIIPVGGQDMMSWLMQKWENKSSSLERWKRESSRH